jgi:hypothetical protein
LTYSVRDPRLDSLFSFFWCKYWTFTCIFWALKWDQVLCYSVHILSFEKKYLRSTIEYLVYKIFRETIPLKEKRWTFLRDRTDILVRDLLCAERTPAFLTAVVRRMHIFSQRHGCNRVQGGGDWPHPILGVLQPDEKIGILCFENYTFKYTCLDYSEGEIYLFVCKILYTYTVKTPDVDFRTYNRMPQDQTVHGAENVSCLWAA